MALKYKGNYWKYINLIHIQSEIKYMSILVHINASENDRLKMWKWLFTLEKEKKFPLCVCVPVCALTTSPHILHQIFSHTLNPSTDSSNYTFHHNTIMLLKNTI